MRDHFEASGDRPALQPEVKMTNEDWQEGQDVEVSMTYETLPQVPEVAFGDVKLEKLVAEIDDAARRRGAEEPRRPRPRLSRTARRAPRPRPATR